MLSSVFVVAGSGHAVLPGITVLIDKQVNNLAGKRVALLTNPSGVDENLVLSADILFNHPQVNLVAFFAPEHGIRGMADAGKHVKTYTDPKTGLPVYSLYGKTRKPTAEMLENIDVVLIDIQDAGVRSYTFIYSMAMVMEAAAENSKKVIILDRPNPMGGIQVAGNILKPEFASFVGMYPIPYLHGMTIGELARLFNNEFGINCELEIIPMSGWKRSMNWGRTGLVWVPTSPHVPHWQTAFAMAATGTFGELHTLSEGVGYTAPFEFIGAPWIDAEVFAAKLNSLELPGVYFRPVHFIPYYKKYKGKQCHGVQMHILNYDTFQPYETGLYILETAQQLYPEIDLFGDEGRVSSFIRVIGDAQIVSDLRTGKPVKQIITDWQDDLNSFRKVREKYLIYK